MILASNNNSEKLHCIKKNKLTTGTEEDQSVYWNEFEGIILGLIILNIFIWYENTSEGCVEITLDNNSAIDESKSDSPWASRRSLLTTSKLSKHESMIYQ